MPWQKPWEKYSFKLKIIWSAIGFLGFFYVWMGLLHDHLGVYVSSHPEASPENCFTTGHYTHALSTRELCCFQLTGTYIGFVFRAGIKGVGNWFYGGPTNPMKFSGLKTQELDLIWFNPSATHLHTTPLLKLMTGMEMILYWPSDWCPQGSDQVHRGWNFEIF